MKKRVSGKSGVKDVPSVRVLLVEDEPEHSTWIGNAIREAVGKSGRRLELTRVSSMDQVSNILAQLNQESLPFECVVSDVMIFREENQAFGDRPYFDWGLAAIRDILLKGFPKERILVYTQFPTVVSVEKELFGLGMLDRVLSKPAHIDNFKKRIQEMIGAS